MNATALLRQRHDSLEHLLERAGEDRSSRTRLVSELVEGLLSYLSIEAEFLAVVADKSGVPLDGHRRRHADVRNAVLQAVFAESDDALFAERLCELRATFRRHARAIEREVVPVAEAALDAAGLEALADVMADAAGAIRDGAAPEAHGHAAE